ncbi:alpha/beta hydrolase [Sphingomonas faeni]|uniref:alpha/beta hydrolase n=1 Tax=Sphingomonas faeni TaxID=185950 RepID=UPI003357E7EC
MTGWTRRGMLRTSGAVVAGTMLADVAVSAATPQPSSEALAHVAPELRPAARQIMLLSAQGGPFTDAKLPKLRATGAAVAQPPLADIPVQVRQVVVGRWQPDVTVYVVNARPGGPARPAILHTHGGGFIVGSAKQELAYLQQLAKDIDCAIVTVEYRLAPETRYTGSIEENYAGLRWLHAQAAMLGVDRSRIAVMGESAGGGHAALLAIVARDRGEVPVAFQSLIYPMLDDRTGGAVRLPPFIGAVGWDGPANQYGWRSFLGMAPGTAQVPSAAVPARVADLRRLPPAFIAVGGVDLFAPEDMTYARRLTESGVATEFLLVPGAFHGFDRVAPETPQAQQFTHAKLAALRRAFATGG